MRMGLPIRKISGAMALGVSRLRSIRWAFALGGFLAGLATATSLFVFAFIMYAPPEGSSEFWASSAHAASLESRPAAVVNPRDSICFIYGVYSVERAYTGTRVRTEFSGTGFLVAPGLVATNGHIAEPWREEDGRLASARTGRSLTGKRPRLERLLAFFPGLEQPVELTPGAVSAEADVAVLRFTPSAATGKIATLALGDPAEPGDEVTVIGYPLGLMGMLAKAPRSVSQRLLREPNDLVVARELARLALIRPSTTSGHLGDAVEDMLVFDASTTHGGSGGPVLGRDGKVIGVTAAYLRGFSGGNLGVSVRALRPLLAASAR